MTNIMRNVLFILLIVSSLETRTSAGPAAYAGCLAKCMGCMAPSAAGGPPAVMATSLFCAALCTPLLATPTP
jgi:hypothetical protein